MTATPCVHCGKTEVDPVYGIADTILHCIYCGHPCCSDIRCGASDHSDNDEDGTATGFYVVCNVCPSVHNSDCECDTCWPDERLEAQRYANECSHCDDPDQRDGMLSKDGHGGWWHGDLSDQMYCAASQLRNTDAQR